MKVRPDCKYTGLHSVWNESKTVLGVVRGTCVKRDFGLGPNAHWARQGEILTFRLVQTSTLGVLSQRIKHGWFVTLSGVKVKNA
jgi:hypothetical protein